MNNPKHQLKIKLLLKTFNYLFIITYVFPDSKSTGLHYFVHDYFQLQNEDYHE
jgi:hypothetical protein